MINLFAFFTGQALATFIFNTFTYELISPDDQHKTTGGIIYNLLAMLIMTNRFWRKAH